MVSNTNPQTVDPTPSCIPSAASPSKDGSTSLQSMIYATETPRLLLEELNEKHLPGIHNIWSSEKTMAWSRWKPTKSTEESKERLMKNLPMVNAALDKYAILLRPVDGGEDKTPDPPKMIGVMGTVNDGLEVAYMLHCDYWNRGYMTESLKAFVGPDGVFWKSEKRKHVHQLELQIDLENVASAKAIEKVGARKGEIRAKSYPLAKDLGDDGVIPEEKKRDMMWWYIDRPRNV